MEKLGEHAVTLYYKDNEGRLSERMLFRNDEPAISLAESECPWGFDAPADEFKLAVEAQRIMIVCPGGLVEQWQDELLEKFILAIVFVDENDQVEGPHYVQNSCSVEPDWGVAIVNYDVRELLK